MIFAFWMSMASLLLLAAWKLRDIESQKHVKKVLDEIRRRK
jgi:hypothetical protein